LILALPLGSKLTRMAGEERSIVSPTPGTTMDSVDTKVTRERVLVDV
jgi:predicted GTPase